MSNNKSWTIHEITLMNWGTYDKTHVINVTPTDIQNKVAVCIEGVNGSGKTTLTDAYMMLIRPEAQVFNAASNASGKGQDKRTVKSYMRGEVGEDPKTGNAWVIRSADIIISAIKGKFETPDNDCLQAAVLMCINCATDNKEHRIYATSSDEIDLSMLEGLTPDNFTISTVQSRLGKNITLTEKPSDYQATLSSTFGISTLWTEFRKLTRLLSMVQGEDTPQKSHVTDLFKTYVLPASDVKQRIADADKTIAENIEALKELTQKHQFIEALTLMHDIEQNFEDEFAEISKLARIIGYKRTLSNHMIQVSYEADSTITDSPMKTWENIYIYETLSQRVSTTKAQLEQLKTVLDEAKTRANKAQLDYNEAESAFRKDVGDKLEHLQAQIKKAEIALSDAIQNQKRANAEKVLRESALNKAQQSAQRCQKNLTQEQHRLERMQDRIAEYQTQGKPFGLSSWPKTKDAWNNMLATISQINLDQEQALKDENEELKDQYKQAQKEMEELKVLLALLKKNKAKLPTTYPNLIRARDRIAEAMGIPSTELPFLAELIDVDETQREWSLGINASIAGTAKRMLIDSTYIHKFRHVAKDIERSLGVRINYTEVNSEEDEKYADWRIENNTLASKIKINYESDYAFSALGMVIKNDAICVPDATHFKDDGHRYLTIGGQTYQRGRGTIGFNRRDTDIIGFVNQADIEDTENQIEDYENDLRQNLLRRNRIDAKLNAFNRQRAFSDEMHRLDFEDLNLDTQIQIVEATQEELNDANEYVAKTQQDLNEAEVTVEQTIQQCQICQNNVNTATATYNKAADDLDSIQEELKQAKDNTKNALDKANNDKANAQRDYDNCQNTLASYENMLHQVPIATRQSLDANDIAICEGETSQLAQNPDMQHVMAQLHGNITKATTKIKTKIDHKIAIIDALCAKYKTAESQLGDETYDNLSGVDSQEATEAQANSELATETIHDPWMYVKITWYTHYKQLLESLSHEWSEIDIIGAKRVCARKCIDTIESLLANAKTSEKNIAHHMRDVRAILDKVRLGSDDHTLNVRYSFRKTALETRTYQSLLEILDYADITRTPDANEADLDKTNAAIKQTHDFIHNHIPEVISTLDPNKYVKISFIETRDGIEHHHMNLGKLSGGEVQQISACVIGAALLYAMGTAPGEKPSYATVMIDEAFVKADEEHSIATLRTLIDMGFIPIVSMPPEGVMKLSPCLSKLLSITKHNMCSQVDDISMTLQTNT